MNVRLLVVGAALSAVVTMWTVEARACGTFVPIEGESATLDAQRVIMAYNPDSNTTRVIAQIGFVGELSQFSWIIPLPSEPSNVQALGEEGARLFAQLDDYGSPKFGVATCGLNNGGGGSAVPGDGVTVLQSGVTGAFEFVVLTGTSGAVVTDWLRDEGYGISEAIAEVAHTYIREGSVFMAMKVNPAALGLTELDPAIRFDYEGWPGYPLRIAQPTTTDELEVILSVIAPQGVSTPGENILTDSAVNWQDQTPEYLDAVRRADGWVVEHRAPVGQWSGGSEGGLFVEATDELYDLLESELGIARDSEPVLTRLHGIFTAEQLGEDAALQLGDHSYVAKVHELYICSPGDLGEELDEDLEENETDDGSSASAKDDADRGCSTVASSPAEGLLLLLAMLGFARGGRRRNNAQSQTMCA